MKSWASFLVVLVVIALSGVMAVCGCGPEPVPGPPPVFPVDTDIFFVGANQGEREITVTPGAVVELGVWRQMSQGDNILVTRKTEVSYRIDPEVNQEGQRLASVQAGILLALAEGDFLVWATDMAQRFLNAEPLVVHVRGPAPPPTAEIVITLPDGTVVTGGMTVTVGPSGLLLVLTGTGPFTVAVLSGPITATIVDNGILILPVEGTPPGTYTAVIQITDATGASVVLVLSVQITGAPEETADAVVVISSVEEVE